MDTGKKDQVLSILTHWINTEFLTQELEERETKTGKHRSQVFSDFDDVKIEIFKEFIRIWNAGDTQKNDKRKTLLTITFGRMNHDLFMKYFLKRHRKLIPSGMPGIDFSENGYFPFGKLFYLYDPGKHKWYCTLQYSPLFVSDWHLRNGGEITCLDTSCNYGYKAEHPAISLIFKQEINRVFRYFKQYIGNVDEEIIKQAFGIRFEKEVSETCTLPSDIANYYIRDLEAIRDLVKKDEYGSTPYEDAVLRLILNENDEPDSSDRINISSGNLENKDKVCDLFLRNMNMAHAPSGKWKGGYRPYLMQQLAVNMFCSGDTPIFTVNGPPGTGKSTLIKEVIADAITKKVKIMCDVMKAHAYDPDAFFLLDSMTGRYLYNLYGINDYSVVITSSTNNAVEKVISSSPQKMFMAMLGKKLNIRIYLNSVKKRLGQKRKRQLPELIENYLNLYESVEQMRKDLEGRQNTVVEGLLDRYYDKDNYESAQLSNPYVDDEFDRQREALFDLARELHMQIASCSGTIARSVSKDGQLNPDTLFFITPVIGTTFASVESMFSGSFNKGQYGMLIVDESGQVLPQNAMGALARSRKALIVGDPKQIPPVVPPATMFAYEFTRPEGSKKRLLTEQPEESLLEDIDNIPSLQIYADAINPYGTEIGGTWVGCPLVLHSRCISPMFEISNSISYDDTMINVTREPSEEKAKEFIFDKSYWIQVKGKEGGGDKNHFVRKQADAVIKMIMEKCVKLNKLKKKDLNIFVISPFVSVSEGLKNYIRNYIKRQEDSGHVNESLTLMKDWIENKDVKSIGTIHTFQGEETDEVIFLLGCDSSSRSSANWVFKNMVNVAASRAKYRLYMVGDMNLWREKTGRTEESPVNKARLKIGNKTKLGLKDIDPLYRPYHISTRRERRMYICPFCGSDVVNGRFGWYCKNNKICGMRFVIGEADIPSTALKKLLDDKEDTWFLKKTIDETKRVHIFPDRIKKTRSGKMYYEVVEETEVAGDSWQPSYKDSNLLLCNCSKLVQDLRKKRNKKTTDISYFDLMILDAVYTIQYGKNKGVFTSYDVLKILSGMRKPDNKSGLRCVIDERIRHMMKTPLFKNSTNKNTLLPHLTIEKGSKTKLCYRINNEGKDGMKPALFDFLNSAKDKDIKPSILELPYLLIDGRNKEDKAIFPNTEKWLEIKYYILYRIAYMYRQKKTSHIINLTNMKDALFPKDPQIADEEISRTEKKRFRDRLSDYLEFLKSKDYINPDSHMIKSDTEKEGYCGVKCIVINPIKPYP